MRHGVLQPVAPGCGFTPGPVSPGPQCQGDAACTAPQAAALYEGRCVECLQDAQCPALKPRCTDFACLECNEDDDCTQDPARPYCVNHGCFACTQIQTARASGHTASPARVSSASPTPTARRAWQGVPAASPSARTTRHAPAPRTRGAAAPSCAARRSRVHGTPNARRGRCADQATAAPRRAAATRTAPTTFPTASKACVTACSAPATTTARRRESRSVGVVVTPPHTISALVTVVATVAVVA